MLTIVFTAAFEVLCPESLSKEQIGQVHPIIIDISKSFFAFLVKNKFYSDALRFAHRMVDIFTAFDLESGICKSMAAITILQIAQGDVVKVRNISPLPPTSNNFMLGTTNILTRAFKRRIIYA